MTGKSRRRELDPEAVERFRTRRTPQERHDRPRRHAALVWAALGIVSVTALLLIGPLLEAVSLGLGRAVTITALVVADVLLLVSVWAAERGRRAATPLRRGLGLALVATAVLVGSTSLGLLLGTSGPRGSALPFVALATVALAFVAHHFLRRSDG